MNKSLRKNMLNRAVYFKICCVCACFIILLNGTECAAQNIKDSAGIKTVTMPAGPQFKATGFKQFWWGRHWRKEWLQPAQFIVFDMDTTAGGLTPTKEGGGHQTKSLRLLNKKGKEYLLRTIDKDLRLLIPDEFKNSIVHDIVNDQISTAHPYGPLAIASLTASAGAMHTNPVIVFVPDNPRLGEYRKDFANKLCLFEERPSGEGWDNTALTNYATDIINSEKLFAKLQADNDKQVDQKEFLKIRLLDMLVNDWDRHPDQWTWAAYKNKGKTTYIPFARDRDQAFSKTDGVNLFLISLPWVLRSLRNMNAHIHDVIGVNLSATSLDKEFMNGLKKEDWVNTIQALQSLITDSAIHKAVLQMPASSVAISGAFVEKRLRQRRDNMLQFGMHYYKVINKKVTITGSDKDEQFTIDKITDDDIAITIQQLNKNLVATDTLFHRVFTHAITKEIYLYGLGSNDRFVFKGQAKNKILLRVFGGAGVDEFLNQTGSSGNGKRTRIYDSTDNRIQSTNAYKATITNDTSYTNYNKKAFKYDWWKPLIQPGYNPDDGFSIGLGISYKKQQWHKYPFGWQQTAGINYASLTSAFSFFYSGVFKQALGKWDIDMVANYKAPNYVLNFYGYGNETKLSGNEKAYYRVRSQGFYINPSVSRSWKAAELKTGLIYQSVKIESTNNKFITQPNTGIDPSVFTTQQFGGANIAYTIKRIVNRKDPSFGIRFHAAAAYLVNLKETKSDHVNLHSNISVYIPVAKGLTLAHRTGAATNIGDYAFYQANSIGGLDYLRGYWRSRFTGKSTLYQNTELRCRVLKLNGYVFRGIIGVYGFFDDGRVWVKNEDFNKLHTGYGGGIYFIPYNTIALNVAYGRSDEANVFTVRTGFFF
ncbi:BamA/TamA family outer membrane protein [Ferruginibacter sp.]